MAVGKAPSAFWTDTGQRIVVAVVVGVALAALGLAWNWGTGGGVVRALGGATQADVEAKLADLTAQLSALKQAPAALPPNAVLAVAGEDCPAPWRLFEQASGRFLLAASEEYPYNQRGGAGSLTLLAENLPQHQHETMLSTNVDGEAKFGYGEVRKNSLQGGLPNSTWRTTMTSFFPPNPARPVDTMPPYYVLQFCRL